MTPIESRAAFESFLASHGASVSSCTPRQGVDLMFAFYQSEKPVGCDGLDGDMLLFQWGTYDWGKGRHFSLNITRQFIEKVLQDDAAISQLSLTFRFDPTVELEELGAGNRWCDGPSEFTLVRDFALSSVPLLAVADQSAVAVELEHSYV
ncbi:hypothetical protein [Roseateles sp.]|uniref:hypothetical protein n=1 Tax=Roseateles sp. TaxID=1971397 RepID=UPI003BA657C6